MVLLAQRLADFDHARPSHMRKLYSVCRAETKIWKEMPNGTHNDTVAEPHYFNHIAEFIRDHVLKESRNKGS